MKALEVKYSFILCIHNSEKYLKECMDSLINQDYKNYEIIVVDNRSSDSSTSIIKEYMKTNSNIKLYYSDSSMVGLARNLGIKKSNGTYFICIDADDYVKPNMLSQIDNILSNKEYDLLRYNALTNHEINNLFNLELESRSLKPQEYMNLVIDTFINDNKISGPMWLYVINKRNFINNNLHFSNKLQEDYGLLFYLIYNSKNIYYLNEELYFYRMNPNGIMLSNNKELIKIKDVIYYSNKYIKYFKNKSIYNKLKEYIEKVLINKFNKLDNKKKLQLSNLLKGSDYSSEIKVILNNSNIQL